MARRKRTQEDTEHRDPITKTPGAHPVGVGAGAAGAGAAGAAIGGAVGGPLAAVVGAAVGAFAGGLGGKAAAESVNPTLENTCWRENYATRPYAKAGEPYETYESAYRYGWEARMMHGDRRWEEIEAQLGNINGSIGALRRAREVGDVGLFSVWTDPLLQPLRRSDLFKSFLTNLSTSRALP